MREVHAFLSFGQAGITAPDLVLRRPSDASFKCVDLYN